MADFLDAYLTKDAPEYGLSDIDRCNNINKWWYFEVSEYYGATPSSQAITRSDVLRVIKGGITKELFDDYDDNVLTNYLLPELRFLHNKATTRYVSPVSREYLYYHFFDISEECVDDGAFDNISLTAGGFNYCVIDGLSEIPSWIQEGGRVNVSYTYSSTDYLDTYLEVNAVLPESGIIEVKSPTGENLGSLSDGDSVTICGVDNGTEFDVEVLVYYTDGTNSGWTTLHTESSPPTYGETYRFAIGPENSGIDQIDNTKTVDYYQVRVMYENMVYSQVITYYVEEADYLDHFFIYENSQGGWDTLRCNGVKQHVSDVEKERLEKYLPYDYSHLNEETNFRLVAFNKGIRVNTGNMSLDEYNDLLEMMATEHIYHEEQSRFIPGVIPPASFEEKPSDDTHYNYDFEWFRSKSEVSR